jgi:hypothetical protein
MRCISLAFPPCFMLIAVIPLEQKTSRVEWIFLGSCTWKKPRNTKRANRLYSISVQYSSGSQKSAY